MHHKLFALGIALACCATLPALAKGNRAKDQEKCLDYGFRPGTDRFADCMMRLADHRDYKADEAKAADQRMRALSIRRNGDERYPICSAASMGASLDTYNNAWYGPDCRQK